MIDPNIMAEVNEYTAGLDDDSKEEIDIDAFPEPSKSKKKRKNSTFDNLDTSKDIGSVHIPPTAEQKELQANARLELKDLNWRKNQYKKFENREQVHMYFSEYDLGYMLENEMLNRQLFNDLLFVSGAETIEGYLDNHNLKRKSGYPRKIKGKGYSHESLKQLEKQANVISDVFKKAIPKILSITKRNAAGERIYTKRIWEAYPEKPFVKKEK